MPKIIWVEGLRGPMIQLLHDHAVDGKGNPTVKPICEYVIPANDATFSLDVLARLYPCKPQ